MSGGGVETPIHDLCNCDLQRPKSCRPLASYSRLTALPSTPLDSPSWFTLHSEHMKIGELAKEGGVSVSTVRSYEAQGLMPRPRTRESGYREDERHDLERLRLIIAARRQRFQLKLIRAALDALDREPEPCREIASLVRERIEALGREIRDLKRLRTHLERQLEAWERGALPQSECLCAILQTDALRPK